MKDFKTTRELVEHLDAHPEDWEELLDVVAKAKEKVEGKQLKTANDFLNFLLRVGKRSSTFQYDDGSFVIYDLDKWDKICERVRKESL